MINPNPNGTVACKKIRGLESPSVGSYFDQNAQSLERVLVLRTLARPQDKHHRVAISFGTGGSL